MKVWEGSQTIELRSAASADGKQVKLSAFIKGWGAGGEISTDDRFELDPGQSVQFICVGLVPGMDASRPSLVEMLLWQEEPSQELAAKDPSKAVRIAPGHSDDLFGGDVEAKVDQFSATLTHKSHQGAHSPAHYRFSIRVRDVASGRVIDWDPDVHDRPPRG